MSKSFPSHYNDYFLDLLDVIRKESPVRDATPVKSMEDAQAYAPMFNELATILLRPSVDDAQSKQGIQFCIEALGYEGSPFTIWDVSEGKKLGKNLEHEFARAISDHPNCTMEHRRNVVNLLCPNGMRVLPHSPDPHKEPSSSLIASWYGEKTSQDAAVDLDEITPAAPRRRSGMGRM